LNPRLTIWLLATLLLIAPGMDAGQTAARASCKPAGITCIHAWRTAQTERVRLQSSAAAGKQRITPQAERTTRLSSPLPRVLFQRPPPISPSIQL
jgi:hypothetical protein